MKRKIAKLTFAVLLSIGLSSVSYESGASPTSPQPSERQESKPTVSLYDQGVAASKNNDFQKALSFFKQALQEDRNNPDILNMLAHTERKLGMLDEALKNYKKALRGDSGDTRGFGFGGHVPNYVHVPRILSHEFKRVEPS